MLDTWHLHRTGGTVADVRALPPGTVHAVQLSDALDDVFGTWADPPTRDRLLPGRGVIPLDEIVSVVRASCPAAVIAIEVFDQSVAGVPAPDRAKTAAAAFHAG
jgi:sugar phosphate isomerase/epimerase